jgi:Mrp family chromosome partitioning ATPase
MAGKRYRVAASRLTSSSPVGNDPLSLEVETPVVPRADPLLPVPPVPLPIPPVSGKALESPVDPDEEPVKPLEDEFDDAPVDGDVVPAIPEVVVVVVVGGVGRATTAVSISAIAAWYIAVGRGA